MYEKPKMERLGTFRELTQDDDDCELQADQRFWSLGENGEDDDDGCSS